MQPLYLKDWRGWLPGDLGSAVPTERQIDERPGSSLPAMLRRRLDETGRAVCDLLAALDPEARCPLIHASRHGDTRYTLSMLEELTAGNSLSPTRFSMSVHNAVIGVHSIARQHHRPLQALGACGQEFDALMTEAAGYLAEGHDDVVAVFSEGPLPEAYAGHTTHPGHPCAVVLRLSRSEGERLIAEANGASDAPTPEDVIDWLAGRRSSLAQRWRREAL
ncbi:beta-ketoacyl synthase chain length factor [Halomonas sp. THAF12]|uniref:beta-ketoacyl synthase chain length factor n=1 Tax=Halomonas sp. B23F22_10 TaxID=3459515 RepID=UPI00373F5CEF